MPLSLSMYMLKTSLINYINRASMILTLLSGFHNFVTTGRMRIVMSSVSLLISLTVMSILETRSDL
jgi:hypothetical protein